MTDQTNTTDTTPTDATPTDDSSPTRRTVWDQMAELVTPEVCTELDAVALEVRELCERAEPILRRAWPLFWRVQHATTTRADNYPERGRLLDEPITLLSKATGYGEAIKRLTSLAEEIGTLELAGADGGDDDDREPPVGWPRNLTGPVNIW